jgi:hypothetical protein
MFRKVKKNTKKVIDTEKEEEIARELDLKEPVIEEEVKKNNELSIKEIKSLIDQKSKKVKSKGIQIIPIKPEKLLPVNKKEEPRESSIKKVFLPEAVLNSANPDELQKLLGIKREDADKAKEEKKRGLIDMQKELFSLPINLQAQPVTKNDHVENLMKLSAAGLIEVPLPLENKLKNIEETEVMKKQIIDNKMAEELDYLKVLKKIGPSYAKGYKSDLSHKKMAKFNNMFNGVFSGANSRRRKLVKEKSVLENRKLESKDNNE